MGTEAFWVPLAISAAGAGAQAVNQHNVERRQEEAATDLMRGQQRKQQQADATLDAELTKLQGSTADAERQKALDGFLQQLRANSASAGGTPGAGEASDRYKTDSAAAGADIKNFGENRSDTLSRVVAPGRQRQNENVSIARAGDDVAGIARNADAERFLQELRIANMRANPWVDAAGQVAVGAGSAMAANGWGTTAAAPKTAASGGFGGQTTGIAGRTAGRFGSGLAPR